MSLKKNVLISKRSVTLLGGFMGFNMCVLKFASGPVEAVSGSLIAVGILVLMLTKSKIGVIIVGSLIAGSGSFLIGHMLGRFLGT